MSFGLWCFSLFFFFFWMGEGEGGLDAVGIYFYQFCLFLVSLLDFKNVGHVLSQPISPNPSHLQWITFPHNNHREENRATQVMPGGRAGNIQRRPLCRRRFSEISCLFETSLLVVVFGGESGRGDS